MRVYSTAAVAAVCLLTVSSAFATNRSRDNLMCFKSKSDAVLSGNTGITFDDNTDPNSPGGSNAFDVGKLKEYCVPAGATADNVKLEDSVLDPNDSWVFYSYKRSDGTKFDKKATRNVSRLVNDKFLGCDNCNDVPSLRLDFGKEVGLIAPANPGGVAPSPGTEDFYKCYQVKPTKASCNGGTNNGHACKDVSECPGVGATCDVAPKFPKELFADGFLGVNLTTDIPTDMAYQLKKLKMVCQTAKKGIEGEVAPGAALLCYAGKQYGGTAFNGSIETASNQFASSASYEVGKPDLFCDTACVEPPSIDSATFSNLVLHVKTLQIGTNGKVPDPNNIDYTAGQGLNIDGNLGTCAPSGNCNAGIDNQLAGLGAIANGALGGAIADGTLHVLFTLDTFGNGTHLVSGYTGEGHTPFGCGNNDPNDPNNFNNAAFTCNYDVKTSSLEVNDKCKVGSEINLPVTISGVTGSPGTGTASGPPPGQSASFSINFSGFQINAENVKVAANFTHDGAGHVSAVNGVIGGSVKLTSLSDIVSGLNGKCHQSTEDGTDCFANTDCAGDPNSVKCSLTDNMPYLEPKAISDFVGGSVSPDLDLDGHYNCEGGAAKSEFCDATQTTADCPVNHVGGDPNNPESPATICRQKESVSLGLVFTGIDAAIVGLTNN